MESCPLDLDGAVMDFECIADSIHDGRQHSIPICRIPNHYVRRHHVTATADSPHVQVMNVVRHLLPRMVASIAVTSGPLRTPSMRIPRLAKQLPRPRQNPKADRHSDNRVDPGPAGEADDKCRSIHAKRAEHVAPNFEVGSFDVEAFVARRCQKRIEIRLMIRPALRSTSSLR